MAYSTPKTRAAAIRRTLKRAYVDHKFTVRAATRGADRGVITVVWHDGPTRESVKALIQPFADPSLEDGVQYSRVFTPDTQTAVEDIWEAAAAPGSDCQAYLDDRFPEWDHNGETVPAGTRHAQTTWIADHVVLPKSGQGVAMDRPIQPDQPDPQEDPVTAEKPRLQAVPDQPAPTAVLGARRKESVRTLLSLALTHIGEMSDEAWEQITADEVAAAARSTELDLRAGTQVVCSLAGDLSTLVTALHDAERDPEARSAAQQIAIASMGRIVNCGNPVLRLFAQTGGFPAPRESA